MKLKVLFFKGSTYIFSKDKGTLKDKFLSSAIWIFVLRLFVRGVSTLKTLILARLLSPNDFGVMGVALLAISILDTFSQTGIQSALIQKKSDVESYLDTAWTIQFLRGIVLSAFLFIAAPYISLFFNNEYTTVIIRFLSITRVLQGSANIGITSYQKELKFKKIALTQMISSIIELLVAYTIAVRYRNVMALIISLILAEFARLVLSYIIHPYRPKLVLNIDKAKELSRYGKWILSSSILLFLVTQGDDIFVGKVLGLTALGIYQLAYQVASMPSVEIGQWISQLMLPTLSKLQNEKLALQRTFNSAFYVTAILSTFMSSIIFSLIPEFSKLFLGEKWLPIIPIVQLLAIAGFIRTVAGSQGTLFQALGKPEIDTKMQWVRLFVLAVIIVPLSLSFHLLGTTISVLISIVVASAFFVRSTTKIIFLPAFDFLKLLVAPVLSSATSILAIDLLRKLIGCNSLAKFTLFVTVDVLVYFTVLVSYDHLTQKNIQAIFKLIVPDSIRQVIAVK